MKSFVVLLLMLAGAVAGDLRAQQSSQRMASRVPSFRSRGDLFPTDAFDIPEWEQPTPQSKPTTSKPIILPKLKPDEDPLSPLKKQEIKALMGNFRPVHLGPMPQVDRLAAYPEDFFRLSYRYLPDPPRGTPSERYAELQPRYIPRKPVRSPRH